MKAEEARKQRVARFKEFLLDVQHEQVNGREFNISSLLYKYHLGKDMTKDMVPDLTRVRIDDFYAASVLSLIADARKLKRDAAAQRATESAQEPIIGAQEPTEPAPNKPFMKEPRLPFKEDELTTMQVPTAVIGDVLERLRFASTFLYDTARVLFNAMEKGKEEQR